MYICAAALTLGAAACACSKPANEPAAEKTTVSQSRPAEVTISNAAAPALTESEIIEKLIQTVASLEGAKFVRNGSEHSVNSALMLIRGKLNNQKDTIATAEQFIQICATRSTTSGKDYEIILKSGERVKSGEWLSARLRDIRNNK